MTIYLVVEWEQYESNFAILGAYNSLEEAEKHKADTDEFIKYTNQKYIHCAIEQLELKDKFTGNDLRK